MLTTCAFSNFPLLGLTGVKYCLGGPTVVRVTEAREAWQARSWATFRYVHLTRVNANDDLICR